MPENISGIVGKLREEEQRLRSQHDVVLRSAQALETEIRRIQNAITALMSDVPVQARNSRGAAKSATVSSDELIAIARKIIERDGPQGEPVLKEKVAERVGELGRTKRGVHFRLQRILKDGPFVFDGARWKVTG